VYELDAVVGDAGVLDKPVARLNHAVTATLRQNKTMVLVTAAMFEELTGSPPPSSGGEPSGDQPFAGRTCPAFERILAGWSRHGPVAHVAASFFGGDGYQGAEVWHAGALAWGPVFEQDFDGPREDWPINAALAQVGVRPTGRTYRHDPLQPVDLFDEVGLGL
jgi:hypothetical protein